MTLKPLNKMKHIPAYPILLAAFIAFFAVLGPD